MPAFCQDGQPVGCAAARIGGRIIKLISAVLSKIKHPIGRQPVQFVRCVIAAVKFPSVNQKEQRISLPVARIHLEHPLAAARAGPVVFIIVPAEQ